MDNFIGFSENTLVVLGNAERNYISQIEEGDDITIFVEERNSKQCFEILNLSADSYLKIRLSDNTIIECGINQEFYVKEHGFIEAKDLEIGNTLIEMDEDEGYTIIIDIETVSESINLYSFVFDSSINKNMISYYVGNSKAYMVR